MRFKGLWQTLYFLWQGAVAWITTYHIFVIAFNMESLGLWARWNLCAYAFVNSSAITLLFQIISPLFLKFDLFDLNTFGMGPRSGSRPLRDGCLLSIIAFPLGMVVIILCFTHVLTTLVMYGLVFVLVSVLVCFCGALCTLWTPLVDSLVLEVFVLVLTVSLTITTVGYATRVYAGEVVSLFQYFDPVKNDFQARTWLSVVECFGAKSQKSVKKSMVFLDLLQRWT